MQRSLALLGLAVLAVVAAAVAVFALRLDRDNHTLRPPEASIQQLGSSHEVRLRLHNPEGSEAYGPLTYNMVVYTRGGLIQTSYLNGSAEDRKRWAACCSLSISPGGTASITLPRQRYAVGYVELVSPMVVVDGKLQVLPAQVSCDLRLRDCRTVFTP
jgi:hypothetical protein